MNSLDRKYKVAVIGSGISGISAAWFLGQQHEVTLFEKNSVLGGHTNTVDITLTNGEKAAVDTGFIVYNEPNYPLLTAMFKHLDVQTHPTEMSFAVSIDQGRLEYAGNNINTLFAQRSNLFSLRHWRMIFDILRFNKQAKNELAQGVVSKLSLGEYLKKHNFDQAMQQDYLLPMAAAIWSCPTETMARFPVTSFLRFFQNHGLLDITNRPSWQTVVQGARTYLDKIVALKAFRVEHQEVQTVQSASTKEEVIITTETGQSYSFDHVVFACHGDEAHALLKNQGFDVLKSFSYQRNQAWLHTDNSQMPKIKSSWAAWNYLSGSANEAQRAVAVTYWMNELQPLSISENVFVTLNPIVKPNPKKVIKKIEYFHPVFDQAAISAQTALNQFQGHRNCWFVGAYTGYGFHEDGLASAARLAKLWRIALPWEVK